MRCKAIFWAVLMLGLLFSFGSQPAFCDTWVVKEILEERPGQPNQPDSFIECFYGNACNRVREETDHGNDGSVDVISYMEYNEQQQMTKKRIDKNADNTIEAVYLYYYDDASDNYTKREYDFGGDGSIESVWYYEYDAKGNKKRIRKDHQNDGSIDAVEEYEYDAHGNVMRSKIDSDYDGDFELITETSYEYSNDRIIAVYSENIQGDPHESRGWYHYENPEHDNPTRVEWDLGDDGSIDHTVKFTYEKCSADDDGGGDGGGDGTGSGSLYFPHVASDGQWKTEIAVVNKSSGRVAGPLAAYDGDGNKLEEESLELSGHARRARVVGEAFSDPDEIRYMVFSADSGDVCGYTKFCQEGKYRVAVPAVREKNRDAIHVPHIASNDTWWTGLALVNTTDTEKTLTIRFDTGRSETVRMAPGAQKSFSIRDRLGAAQPDIKSAEIEGGAGVIGLELFAHKKEPQLSGVLLRDQTAENLYFPHVATDGTWWTGIAAYNPAGAGAGLTITPYKEDGTALGKFSESIPAGGKYLTSAAESDLPEDAAWFRIDATRPLSGFELFCGSSPARLGGYSAVDIKRQKGVFPKLEDAGWTGIAFVNTAASSAEVTLRLYRNNGSRVKQTTRRLDPHEKVVQTGQGLFGAAAADGTYIDFSADKDVVGFQLNSSAKNRMLDGLPGM